MRLLDCPEDMPFFGFVESRFIEREPSNDYGARDEGPKVETPILFVGTSKR